MYAASRLEELEVFYTLDLPSFILTSVPNHPPGILLFNKVRFPIRRHKRLYFTACKKGPALLRQHTITNRLIVRIGKEKETKIANKCKSF